MLLLTIAAAAMLVLWPVFLPLVFVLAYLEYIREQ